MIARIKKNVFHNYQKQYPFILDTYRDWEEYTGREFSASVCQSYLNGVLLLAFEYHLELWDQQKFFEEG